MMNDCTFSNAQRAQVLTQALPYIRQYNGKVVVIKYGGNAMINEERKQQVMEDIVLLWLVGVKVVLVHGGGPEISDLMEKLSDSRVKTELDWQIYKLQRRYLDYQVNIGNQIIELLSSGVPEDHIKAQHVSLPKTKFQNTMDELFSETGKKIDRRSNEILFIQGDVHLTPYQLSSGEKQMLVILLTVLVENGEHYALLMDEPEISLHVEWQQRLISLIRTLNPNVQIILTTHSPAVIMNGWIDAVTEVSDITTR